MRIQSKSDMVRWTERSHLGNAEGEGEWQLVVLSDRLKQRLLQAD